MRQWPRPNTVKQLRGFLGLTGYYRKFVKGYGILAKPLTDLLKKDGFNWNADAETAFQTLKTAMCNTPVLALPDFNQPFIIETDACAGGMGAVLMQGKRPIAYMSKGISKEKLGMSIYEKELLALVTAVGKWRHYLEGHHFIIKTDHQSLKYLLEQRITTPLQQKWLTKLLGLSYEIQYKKGAENLVADALSRREEPGVEVTAISQVVPTWVQEVMESYQGDAIANQLIEAQLIKPGEASDYSYKDGLLKHKGRLYVGSGGQIRAKLIQNIHSSQSGGHSGVQLVCIGPNNTSFGRV